MSHCWTIPNKSNAKPIYRLSFLFFRVLVIFCMGKTPVSREGLSKTARPWSSLPAQPLLLFSLVSVLRVLICVSRFLLGVSWLTRLKEVTSISFGGIKDVYLAETIQNTCSFTHSWQREGDSLLKTQKKECNQQVVLCQRENRHTAPSSEEWYMAPPRSSWYHPNAPDFQCSRSAASLWFLLGGLDCGKRALCTLPVHGNSCNLKHINTFLPQAVSN